MAKQSFEAEIGGRVMTIETGVFAQQADAAVTVRYGDTLVLATAVMSNKTRDGIDYFPLTVDYEERLYAAGKIKGSRFIKREGRPTDEAILTARLVDRSVRPLFDDSIRNDVQVVITVLSIDNENDPDVPALVAASTALAMSKIPWAGPIAGCRVGIINGEWVLNPTNAAREKSDMDLVVSGLEDTVLMIEAGGKEIPEQVVLGGISFAQKHLKKTLTLINQVVAAVGDKKMEPVSNATPEEKAKQEHLVAKVESFIQEHSLASVFGKSKTDRLAAIAELKTALDAALKADSEVDKEGRLKGVGLLEHMIDEEARRRTLEDKQRADGRAIDEIRPLSVEVGILPRTHGSGLFTRGETQVLSAVTLGSPGDEQTLDSMEESGKKRYMHHYNFPGFSVGEVKPIRSPGRREIGHGALAEKAIEPLLPDKEQFPYTIRVVSEVLASNGSSSQASVCGSSLALMDAGVPLKAPCAGIAMGLIQNPQTGKYVILTDIQGVEDHAGDMDFKVAGTKTGITAVQLDVKNLGLTYQMCEETLAGARTAREKILATMSAVISEPRKELSQYAPRISSLRIDPEKIREVIGRGGETINKIIEECGGIDVTKIDIEDDGLVMVTSTNQEMGGKAISMIENIVREVQVGETFEGKVIDIIKDRNSGGEIGAIVELFPGHDGMVHISEFSDQRIGQVSDVCSIGDTLKVVVTAVDKERGRVSLSVKQAGGTLPRQPKPMTDDGFREPHSRGGRPRFGGNGGDRGGRFDRPRHGGGRGFGGPRHGGDRGGAPHGDRREGGYFRERHERPNHEGGTPQSPSDHRPNDFTHGDLP